MIQTQAIALNPSVVTADLEGEMVLLDTETGIYLGLNESGAAIWRLLERGATVDDIAERLADEYDVDATTIGKDVDEFLGQLVEAGLVGRDDA